MQNRLAFIFTEKGFYLESNTTSADHKPDELEELFQKNRYQALYELGFRVKPDDLDSAGIFLYRLADEFTRALTQKPELELSREQTLLEPDENLLDRLTRMIPFAIGSEYVNEDWIRTQFAQLTEIFRHEISCFRGTVAMYLAGKSQSLHVPERIFFHLVEAKDDYPFAFLATYATRDERDNVRHMPLQYALTEYGAQREKLLELLSCLNRVAEVSQLIGSFIESGELFHPLRLTAEEAYQFLKDVPAIESQGVICRIPNWWRKNAASVSLAKRIGEKKPTYVGMDSVLSVTPQLMVNGVPLSRQEIEDLMAQTEGLAFLKGKWIEVDHAQLRSLLKQMEEMEGSVTLLEAMRMGITSTVSGKEVKDPNPILNGKWLADFLKKLRSPQQIRSARVPSTVHAELRSYQKSGYTWLKYMQSLGLGACLADDMGLGKTLQVLTFLEKVRSANKHARVLLIAPASLLGNWQKEAEKFVPAMPLHILYGKRAEQLGAEVLEKTDFLTITTYGMAARIEELGKIEWDCLVLDEAQAIKNPGTKQTRQIKKIKAKMKIAMTGTPIENELANLWSLFDFLDKGLLGSRDEFSDFCKSLNDHPEGYAHLKNMIAPFMLRRLKTDKTIIPDLPDKLEQVEYVEVSKRQAVLYRKYVAELAHKLEDANGMQRRGLILGSLTKLKQICNHPDQYLGQSGFLPSESGKFEYMEEICQTIAQKHERVLVFTQFREITEYLDRFLQEIFQAKGYVIHGGVPAAKRTRIVEAFQGEQYVPYVVLSLKAGGTGLNLTAATHVIHFDRWWNPAVENQATDRAFRIGQKSNVLVHKLVCRGTIEEKIDAMLNDKMKLAENVIGSGGENWITELSNEELMSMLRLD